MRKEIKKPHTPAGEKSDESGQEQPHHGAGENPEMTGRELQDQLAGVLPTASEGEQPDNPAGEISLAAQREQPPGPAGEKPDMTGPDRQAGSAGEKFAQYGVADSGLARVIVQFAEPMLKFCATYQAREEAISYAIFAWNLALEPESARDQQLQRLLAQQPPDKTGEISALLRYLLQRKEAHFADNRFMIIDYRLDRVGEKMHIEVTTKYLPRN